jgi:hypothetical protein
VNNDCQQNNNKFRNELLHHSEIIPQNLISKHFFQYNPKGGQETRGVGQKVGGNMLIFLTGIDMILIMLIYSDVMDPIVSNIVIRNDIRTTWTHMT